MQGHQQSPDLQVDPLNPTGDHIFLKYNQKIHENILNILNKFNRILYCKSYNIVQKINIGNNIPKI